MSSRAYLLLERENRKLKKNNYKGISAFPVSEDLLEWEAVIEGLQDTIWQGLFFQLKINFTLKYNLAPPFVKFKTIPFHPNVDQHTGQPCIDFLDNPNKWNTSYTLSSILLTLQVMLSNPVLENPVNLEAAKILTKDESKYRLIVLKLFQQPLQCIFQGWVCLAQFPPAAWAMVVIWLHRMRAYVFGICAVPLIFQSER
ncbi:ubiquitin-conjugating enzyme E2 U isoform X9 [Talpa occidentalis]|uniref:ubiquitin-conjugating enzyme E2 U isoform X9 n=1 Tax=Talpa occidentalis TaxID=50954 RepID=UPI00188F5050|nr:ubiquitin-conjugating enzyme E2 U isoform X9 [Talpa occidentalis]